ncbi:la-related protein 7 [Topomyia yanbarensis]|uniref:la-related protein 7 n=1 Tax=Topomyia yanbarensis TaxID=2498891 RepID=UPI00273C1575|nr:la-related protein 7 [Topomyia yanbarensis]XP_058824614.1 la-related protein 7 [Topomyia yanbarensis]
MEPVATSTEKLPHEHDTKNESPSKKGRHRKKYKFNAIRSQMEFYFSDANLSKDRYLGQCIKNDPFVALSEFLKFNRIKKLTDSVEDIVIALKNSELLQLSEDRSKVRRITEHTERPNCEECTIYVECLPPKADHDWVRNVFSAYGKVAYVSLPKFKYSKKIKEFGFIEFEKESSVQKALKTFQAFGGVLTYEGTEPDKLVSITSFKQEKEEEMKMRETGEDTAKNDGQQDDNKDQSEMTENKDEDFLMPPPKRLKRDDGDSSDTDTNKDSGNEDFHSENEVCKDEEKAHEEDTKKKRRRRRGPSGIKKEIQQDDKVYELKIMAKKEWRRLRNKYLNLQRVEAKKLKKLFNSTKFSKPNQSRTPNQSTSVAKTVRSSPRVNFYGALTDEEAAAEAIKLEEQDQQNKQPLFSFEPGLIVNIKFRVPCANIKDFKAELKQYAYVKYIDLREGDMETFVRVDKPSSANQLVKEYGMAEYSAQILSGENEKTYWDKIKRDREDKLNKKVKVEKLRGRTKLLKKVNTHIKFEDDD